MDINRISPNAIEVIRADEGSNKLVVEGYAAVYDKPSKVLSAGGKKFVETIERGAFKDAVTNVNAQRIDCVATFQHDRSTLLARTSSGTLELESDDVGLKFRFELPDTAVGRDVAVLLERGDLSQCSFVARAKKDDIELKRADDGLWSQKITRFTELNDVSLVIDPAYPDTSAYAEVERSISEIEEKEKRMESENAMKESQLEMLNKIIEDEN